MPYHNTTVLNEISRSSYVAGLLRPAARLHMSLTMENVKRWNSLPEPITLADDASYVEALCTRKKANGYSSQKAREYYDKLLQSRFGITSHSSNNSSDSSDVALSRASSHEVDVTVHIRPGTSCSACSKIAVIQPLLTQVPGKLPSPVKNGLQPLAHHC